MKSVEYQIRLLDSPGNAAALKGLTDSIKRSFAEVEASVARVGESGRNATRIQSAGGSGSVGGVPDYSSQLAALDKFRTESESRFRDAGRSGKDAFESSFRGLDDDLKQSGAKAASKFRDGFTGQIGQLAGFNDEQMRDLFGVDGESVLRLADETADTFREQMKKQLGQDLGMGDTESKMLFGAQGGAGLAGQQRDHQDSQAAGLDAIGANVAKMEQLKEAGQQTSASLSKNFREIAEKAEMGASGIGQMAQGLSFLFADSKDAKVLIDSLLAIKGTTDLVLGGVKSVSGALQVFSLFGDRSAAQAKAKKAEADATKLAMQTTSAYVEWLQREGIALEQVTGGNKEHAAALREVAAAADKAAKEEKQLHQEQAKDGGLGARLGDQVGGLKRVPRGKKGLLARGAGLFRGVAGSAVGNAVGDSSGIVDSAVDTGFDYVQNKGAGKLLKFGKIAGAVGAALAIGKIGYDTAAGGGEIKQDSMSGKFFGGIGSSRLLGRADRAMGLDTTGAALAKSFEELDRAVKRNTTSQNENTESEQRALSDQMERQSKVELSDFRDKQTGRLRGLSVGNRDMTAGVSAGIESAGAAKALAAELERIKTIEGSVVRNELERNEAIERAAELYERQITAQEAVISAVQQEASERKRLNSESIGAAEQRIGLVEREKGLYQSAEQKIEAAAQKFARLSEEEKASTLNAKRVADSGGRLSKKQKSLLESVGLGSESDAVKRQDLAEARSSGFFDNFGGFEKQQMRGSLGRADQLNDIQRQAEGIGQGGSVREREARLRALTKAQEGLGLQQQFAGQQRAGGLSSGERRFDAQAQQVRVEIADRKEFNVKIEANSEAIVRGVVEQVRQALAAQEVNMRKMIVERLNKQQNDFATANQAAAMEKRQALLEKNR